MMGRQYSDVHPSRPERKTRVRSGNPSPSRWHFVSPAAPLPDQQTGSAITRRDAGLSTAQPPDYTTRLNQRRAPGSLTAAWRQGDSAETGTCQVGEREREYRGTWMNGALQAAFFPDGGNACGGAAG